MDKEIKNIYKIGDKTFLFETYEQPLRTQIEQLKQELEQAQTRIKELEDKDWYEANIKQLEEQNDRLIQERDNLKQQLVKLQSENKMLKEFADKLDEEFGKNVEPTLSEKADNIIALYRTNKKYCEMADEKIKELKQQLEEKDKEIEDCKRNELYEENMKILAVKNQKQLAINELEKLRNDIWELNIGDYYLQNGGTIENIKVKRKEVYDLIDNQIKELKGE